MSGITRITVDPDILLGKPIIKGPPIAVAFVIDRLGRGWTVEQVLREHDHGCRPDAKRIVGRAT